MIAHDALIYRGADELAAGVRNHVETGLAAGAAVAVAVPRSSARVLRPALAPYTGHVRLLDMEDVGRNPGRIIPTLHDWVDEEPGRTRYFVGQPIWPGRSEREIVEAHRHEALLNLAFRCVPINILCPYDAGALPPDVLDDAERTHPTIIEREARRASRCPHDALSALEAVGSPLPPAPVRDGRPVTLDLVRMRRFVREEAGAAGLSDRRLEDLLLAVNEAATNTLLHGGGDGVVRVWHQDDEVVCEVACSGRIRDPLAGRRRPDARRAGGRGLWLINQLCDLVELRAGADGTTLRLHMALR